MQVHLSLGVATLVALMQTHRPPAGRPMRDAEEAARIDAWLQGDMLLVETDTQPCATPAAAPHEPRQQGACPWTLSTA